MFAKAVDFVKSIQDQLHPGWTYRGECLDEPKHNALQYSRVPVGNVILFDVSIGNNYYLPYQEKQEEEEEEGEEVGKEEPPFEGEAEEEI